MIRILALLAVLIGTVDCGSGAVGGNEVARASSPDGKVDAVLVTHDTGATVPTPTELYITSKGAKPRSDERVLRAEHVRDATLTWQADRLLELSYGTARIYTFKNVWFSPAVDNYEYRVEIKLRPTAERSLP